MLSCKLVNDEQIKLVITKPMVSLIANTGIQLMNFVLEIPKNSSSDKKIYFHEWIDDKDKTIKLEIAHCFADEEDYDIWVRKIDLYRNGCVDTKNGEIKYNWNDIKDDIDNDCNIIFKGSEGAENQGCFHIDINSFTDDDWAKYENIWLPLPFFKLSSSGKSIFSSTNWCRFKLIPVANDRNARKYDLLLAFDTRSYYEFESLDELKETPIFVDEYDRICEYAICNDENKLVDYLSSKCNCKWVDDYLMLMYHGVKEIQNIKQKPQLKYLAEYIFIIRYIQQLGLIPTIELCSDRVENISTNLVVDIGNSRTCAVLFEDNDFTKVEQLELQNFTNPIKDHKLNKQQDSFDMRLAFRKADLGAEFITGSKQFIYPSLVRLGDEANELIHKATNENTGHERVTTFSSPKRYLWDSRPQNNEWEFITFSGEKSEPIYLKGISEQLNPDGTINIDGAGGQSTKYPRKTLMTFCFLEILAQANMQINSYEYRHRKGDETTPRRIDRIVVTSPTAMSRKEQAVLRESARNAFLILKRFYEKTSDKSIDESDLLSQMKIIPSPEKLTRNTEIKEWIYDEATCSQFVFLYAEISQRYLNKCKDYVEFYGKKRNDLDNYDKKSLTIGSVDIGAGTTDMMIASYKYDDGCRCILTPVPLFWESFYYAGDDMLKEIIRRVVIEGDNSGIQRYLIKQGRTADVTDLISGFFGKDDALMTKQARQIRSEFNLQVSMPIGLYMLNMLQNNVSGSVEVKYSDVFKTNKPTDDVIEYFKKHFGFDLENVVWEYNMEFMSDIVRNVFGNLAGKISVIIDKYNCDFVILSGRPTSLLPLSNLFVENFAIHPDRLIKLNEYMVGKWYPFHGKDGYFGNSKTIVAVGAMIGDCACNQGGLDGFKLNLNEIASKLMPTTDYFGLLNNKTLEFETAFITPTISKAIVEVEMLPKRFGCRQKNSSSYPSRPFYTLDINREKLIEKIKNKYDEGIDPRQMKALLQDEIVQYRHKMPLTFTIVREDYTNNKEILKIESVRDRNNDELKTKYFSIQVQSLSESDTSWLDTGEFINLNINPIK